MQALTLVAGDSDCALIRTFPHRQPPSGMLVTVQVIGLKQEWICLLNARACVFSRISTGNRHYICLVVMPATISLKMLYVIQRLEASRWRP